MGIFWDWEKERERESERRFEYIYIYRESGCRLLYDYYYSIIRISQASICNFNFSHVYIEKNNNLNRIKTMIIIIIIIMSSIMSSFINIVQFTVIINIYIYRHPIGRSIVTKNSFLLWLQDSDFY